MGETLESREIRESMKILRSLALEGKGPPTRPTLQSHKERIHSFWRGACSALEEVAELHAQTDEKKRGNMYTQSHGPQQSATVVGPRNHQKL